MFFHTRSIQLLKEPLRKCCNCLYPIFDRRNPVLLTLISFPAVRLSHQSVRQANFSLYRFPPGRIRAGRPNAIDDTAFNIGE